MGEITVKPLEWIEHPTAHAWRADTMIGTYQVWVGSLATGWWFDGFLGERINIKTPDEFSAKAAAQADYERRILSMLDLVSHNAEITRLRGAIKMIAEGHFVEAREDRFVVIENPDFKPDNGSDPFIVIEAANEWNRLASHTSALAERDARIAELEAALKPFATAGRIIDGPFSPALFAEDDMAFQSGCAWSENGVSRTITWGDFRRARAALKERSNG